MDSRVNGKQSLNYDPWKTAFDKAKNQGKECDWTGLKFIHVRTIIFISTNGSIIRFIDALHGIPLQTFTGQLNNKGIPIEASFIPDLQFLFCGSRDGRVHVWHTDTGYKVCILYGDHPTPVQCALFTPKYMMLAINFERLIDAFHGTPLQTFTGQLNNKVTPIEASFCPDSQFVFSGSTDGRVHVWNAHTGYKVCILNGNYPAPVQYVQFNRKYTMLVSACTNMAFWLLTVHDVAQNEKIK